MNHTTTTPSGPRRWAVAALLLLTTWLSAANIDAVYPNNARTGSTVTVVVVSSGGGLTGATGVNFGTVPADSIVVDSDNQITAIVTIPAFATTADVGLRNVTITGGGTAGAFTDGFTFVQDDASPSTVVVTITASITSSLSLAWTENTTGKVLGESSAVAWNLTGLSAGAVRDTNTAGLNTDAINFEVVNLGNGPAHITVSTTAASTDWSLGASAGTDIYGLAVNNGANQAPAWLVLSPGTLSQTLNGGAFVLPNGRQAFDLRFSAPLLSTVSTSQTITATVTAAP
jgi:hypothetical protein